MKIGILGTRGIPNRYGGFEEFAEKLAVELVQRGNQVWVYNSSLHPFEGEVYHGVQIVRCNDPENRLGSTGQFFYDLNCILDARKRDFDILLQLGYTSSSVWKNFLPRPANIVTNMDGLEWKRSKYSKAVQQFLKTAERWAVISSDELIADSTGIQSYLLEKYHVNSTYIPYGAQIPEVFDEDILEELNLAKGRYDMLVARMEPENNIALILEGVRNSHSSRPMVVVGNANNKFGSKLKTKFEHDQRIVFAGPVFDDPRLDTLRRHCHIYFHGHSVGGTNPSLLEAMACSAFIVAHHNPFNSAIIENRGRYFSSSDDIAHLRDEEIADEELKRMRNKNLELIRDRFNWQVICDQYEALFSRILVSRNGAN